MWYYVNKKVTGVKQKSFALRQATAHNENKEKNSFLKSNTGYADPSTSEAKKEEKERAYLTTYMRSRMKKGKQKKKDGAESHHKSGDSTFKEPCTT